MSSRILSFVHFVCFHILRILYDSLVGADFARLFVILRLCDFACVFAILRVCDFACL